MRWRRIAMVAGVLLIAGTIGAVSWGLLAYNEVTKVDRSEPQVVTDEFLRATLVRKDKAGADLYACNDQTNLASVKALREELDRRERDFGVTIVVSWGAYERFGDDLTTKLTITALKGNAVESKNDEAWKFALVNDGGWRVCGSEKIEVNPT